jgi:DNA (cytosine-5)-methyltransferase 1
MNDHRTHIDLFSGIGGFAIAANAAGYDTRVFCEQDDYCTKVLNRHWPTVPVIRDIREFDGSKWRGADLLTGGFPCQPFSQAGEQRGEEDDRHLWPEMFRVIKEARPDFVLAENVAGLINMALDDVLSQLEGEGYTTGAVVLPACSLNAPHRRDRVWIVAHAERVREPQPERGKPNERRRVGDEGEDVADADSHRRVKMPHREPGKDSGGRSSIPKQKRDTHSTQEEVVVNPDSKRPQGCAKKPIHGVSTQSRQSFRTGEDIPNIWTVEPNVGRVAHGIPKRVDRLKALGNAIVPQVAYEIIRLMDNED